MRISNTPPTSIRFGQERRLKGEGGLWTIQPSADADAETSPTSTGGLADRILLSFRSQPSDVQKKRLVDLGLPEDASDEEIIDFVQNGGTSDTPRAPFRLPPRLRVIADA